MEMGTIKSTIEYYDFNYGTHATEPLFAQFPNRTAPVRGTWWTEYYAANPGQSDEKVAEELSAQNSKDLLKQALDDQLRGDVFTKAPRFFETDHVPVARPQSLRNVGTVTLREKLFGYKTLNCLQPDKIFPQFGEYYPITLQDYRLSFQLNSSARHLFKNSQTKAINQANPVVQIGKVLVANQTRVYVRSRDSEVQSDKELIKANFFYPEIERFQTITSHVGEVVDGPIADVHIKCVTGSRLPDYFFFYVERISEDLGLYQHECPKIESIKITRNSQATRIYTGGGHYKI